MPPVAIHIYHTVMNGAIGTRDASVGRAVAPVRGDSGASHDTSGDIYMCHGTSYSPWDVSLAVPGGSENVTIDDKLNVHNWCDRLRVRIWVRVRVRVRGTRAGRF